MAQFAHYALPDAPWQLDDRAEAHTLALVERVWGVLTRCAEAELLHWQTLSRAMCVSQASEGVQAPARGRVLEDVADKAYMAAMGRFRARTAEDLAAPVLTQVEPRVGYTFCSFALLNSNRPSALSTAPTRYDVR